MAHPDTCPVSFIYTLVASMWVITLHSLFLYSNPPLPSPSFLLAQTTFKPNLFQYNTPTFSNLVHSTPTYPPMKMEQRWCSKTLAYKIQMPGNYPEESIQHSEHSEHLKSRILFWIITSNELHNDSQRLMEMVHLSWHMLDSVLSLRCITHKNVSEAGCTLAFH
jgi:hypothetical protein